MSEIRERLEQIRDLLKSDPPDGRKALRLVKDLLMHDTCFQACESQRAGAALLLEQLVLPALVGTQEHQARVGRLIRRIHTAHSFDPQSMAADLQEIAVWLSQLQSVVQRSEPEPPFPAALLQSALITLGGKPVQEIVATDKAVDWQALYLQLGAIIHQENRWRAGWQQEQQALKNLLAGTTQVMADNLRMIGADAGDLSQRAEALRRSDGVIDWAGYVAALLQGMERFRDRALDIRQRLRGVQEAAEHSRVLIRQADWALMETRDEKLLDIHTGLPNRFGLLARLEQAKQLAGQEGFALVVVLLEEYSVIVRELGRDRVNRLMAALAGRMVSLMRPGDYLARYGEETFVLLALGLGEPEAVAVAAEWQDILDHTRFELSDALLSVRTYYGVACYEQGENTEALLGLANMAAQESMAEGGVRVRSIPPRQKVPPTPPPPPPRRRFGFL
ncbi:MAG: diguanylate cyclase [Magnetococcales bacterium]|nr:diguanylate cyclase [Magnetococcales bacterium]